MWNERAFLSGDDDAMHLNNNAAPRYSTQVRQSEIEQREAPEQELPDSLVYDSSLVSLEDMFNDTVILSQGDEPADWSVPSALSSVSPPDGSGGRIKFTEKHVPIIPDAPLHQEKDLIDLSPRLAVAVSASATERLRIENEMSQAPYSSNSNGIGEKGKNSAQEPDAPSQPQTLSRPKALSFQDRCITPVRSKSEFTASQPPKSPVSPTRSKSEVFLFTYETSAHNPLQSPVPPFVFVHSAGHANVVVRPTGNPTCVPVPEAGGDRLRPCMCHHACAVAVAILLIIAGITIVAGVLTARQLEENGIDADPRSIFPRVDTPFPTRAPSISVPATPPSALTSTPPPSTPVPVPSPVFVFPAVPGNNNGETPSPVFGPSDPGRAPKEETESPASIVSPTPPPRAPRPSPSIPIEETPSPVYVPPNPSPRAPTHHPMAPINPTTPAPSPDRTQREETFAPQEGTTVPPRVPLPTPFPTFIPSPSDAPSAVPSVGPSSFRPTTIIERFLIGLIASASPSSFLALSHLDSPEYMALQWVAADPDVANVLYSNRKIVQRWALAVLFFVANGDSWYQSNNWLLFTDECTWFSKASGSICDSDGLLITLDLQDNGLVGTLPPQISLLLNLRTLNLQDNRLQGSIPMELSFLSNSLILLFLRGNDIRGKIPIELTMLKNLEYLQLSTNRLSGSIPTEIGNLSRLVVLGLGRNNLGQTIPTEIGRLRKLNTLGLEKNSLTGPIPSEMGGMNSMKLLNLDYNDLSGAIPSELGALSTLETLKLNANDLHGRIPGQICDLIFFRLSSFAVDCQEVTCSCCNKCCADDAYQCTVLPGWGVRSLLRQN